MTERELEAFIQNKTGWSAIDIRQMVNDIVFFIYGKDCRQFLFIDENNKGLPPFLTTVAGQYKYEFPSGTYSQNVRRTAAIISKTSNTYRRYGWETYAFQQEEYYKLPIADQKDARETTPAYVTFDFDPGDTTEQYYHLFYINPTPITSASIEIPIPPNYHLQLRRCILALIQEEDYGADIWKYVEKTLASKIWSEANRGADTSDHRVPIREEYRMYKEGHSFTGRYYR